MFIGKVFIFNLSLHFQPMSNMNQRYASPIFRYFYILIAFALNQSQDCSFLNIYFVFNYMHIWGGRQVSGHECSCPWKP